MGLTIKRKETYIEELFVQVCEAQGWIVRKQAWPGHRGAPDRVVYADEGVQAQAETKRKDKDLEIHQEIEHRRLLAKGHIVMRIRKVGDITAFVAAVNREIRRRRGEVA